MDSNAMPVTQVVKEFFSLIPDIENAAPVPTLHANTLSEKEFKAEWVDKNKACLIKGAVKHWPAVQKWRNKDYWMVACENLTVAAYPHMNYNDRSRQKLIGDKESSFHEVLDWLFTHKHEILSIPGQKITEKNRYAALLKDMPGFSFLEDAPMPRMYERRRFFMYRGAGTAWHYHDVDETLMCQVVGSKRVGLLPPDIPNPRYVSDFLLGDRHLHGEVLHKHLDLKPMIADVEEGDAMYIPPYWYHGVIPVDFELGFTLAFCWRSPIHILGNFSNFFVRKLYKDGMWPVRKITPFLPLLGVYAGLVYSARKISGKA